MRRFIFFNILLLLFAVPVLCQDDQGKVRLPDSVMKDVLHDIIKSTIKPPADEQLVYLPNMGLGTDWLPEIKNVEFVLLEKNGNQGYGREIYFWKDLRKEKGVYKIDFGHGDPGCSASGATWAFQVVNSEVKDLHTDGGWGSGCSAGSGWSPK
jgi:hypothetical protein